MITVCVEASSTDRFKIHPALVLHLFALTSFAISYSLISGLTHFGWFIGMYFSPLFLMEISFFNSAIFLSQFTFSQDRPKQMQGKSRFGSQHDITAVCGSQHDITAVCGILYGITEVCGCQYGITKFCGCQYGVIKVCGCQHGITKVCGSQQGTTKVCGCQYGITKFCGCQYGVIKVCGCQYGITKFCGSQQGITKSVAVSRALQQFVPCHIYFPLPAIIPLMLDVIKLGMSGTSLQIMTSQPSAEVWPLNQHLVNPTTHKSQYIHCYIWVMSCRVWFSIGNGPFSMSGSWL